MSLVIEKLPPHLAQPSRLGTEIALTGKWTASTGKTVGRSAASKQLLHARQAIHDAAASDPGILSTEFNHGVGQDAILDHHVFQDAKALVNHLKTADENSLEMAQVGHPGTHLIRGIKISAAARQAILATGVPAVFGEFLFGYVKRDYERPDLKNAIMVTAKWTCKPGASVDELTHWWQQVGTDAFDLEKGLLRFEVYRVVGEDALIIHEVFENTSELFFHLTKGTAAKYKKQIDQGAFPECYYFRGPVSWIIRTYSKFMKLPATYSTNAARDTQPGGSMSEGTTA